jgi:hypothetical protein
VIDDTPITPDQFPDGSQPQPPEYGTPEWGPVAPDVPYVEPVPYGGEPAAYEAADVPAGAEEGEAKTGFFSTRGGRLVLIGGAVAILLVVAGIAAAVLIAVLGVFGGKPAAVVTPVPAATTTNTSAAVTPAPESSAATITIAPITNSDVYTVRDPFQPLIENPVATATAEPSGSTTPSTNTSGSSGGSGTTTGTAGNEDTLVLLAVVTESGEYKGKFQIGNAIYVAGAGEQLGTTPWQVVSVESNSAVVLYGDEQLTLVVGQSLSK